MDNEMEVIKMLNSDEELGLLNQNRIDRPVNQTGSSETERDPVVLIKRSINALKKVQQVSDNKVERYLLKTYNLQSHYYYARKALYGKPTIPARIWLNLLTEGTFISDFISELDKIVLVHLTDLTVKVEPLYFTLEFHFEENGFFTNSVLRLRYYMECKPYKDGMPGDTSVKIVKCEGCDILWEHRGAEVSQGKKDVRPYIKRKMEQASFFNLFNPTAHNSIDDHMDAWSRSELIINCRCGDQIRRSIIPMAVYYYTQEVAKAYNSYLVY